MKKVSKNKIRESVMENYRKVALRDNLDKSSDSDCCSSSENDLVRVSDTLGYSSVEYNNVPFG
jgi:hypothetical protein